MKKIIQITAGISTFVLLCFLGIWQVQRMEYKNALISKLTHSLSIATETKNTVPQSDMLYRKLKFCGTYLNQHNLFAYSKAGYVVLTPLELENGEIILISRGTMADKNQLFTNNTACVSGILMPAEKKPLFMPECDGSKSKPLLSMDLGAVREALNLKLADIYLLMETSDNTDDRFLKQLNPPNPQNIYNHHMEYAIMWFVLAGIAAIYMAILYRSNTKSKIK